MKQVSRCWLLLVVSGLVTTGPLPGCEYPMVRFHTEPEATEHTIPIRVGVLSPVDSRPEPERDPPHHSSMPLFLFTPVFHMMVFEEVRMRDDSDVNLDPATTPVFGKHRIADVLGSYALRVVRRTGAFQDAKPVHRPNWTLDQLPLIAQQTGLRYLMAIEVRHFYALQYSRTTHRYSVLFSKDLIPKDRKRVEIPTSSFESTVMRFRLFEVEGDEVRVFWQLSTRASRGSSKKPDALSGSATVADCLGQLAAGLDELTRRYAHDVQTTQ